MVMRQFRQPQITQTAFQAGQAFANAIQFDKLVPEGIPVAHGPLMFQLALFLAVLQYRQSPPPAPAWR
ncbi:hypothetical protein A3Q32_00925 [Alcanivorax sp. KX64203]|nr:hypothetical protein A3Q32_00925 [Alcanivorax sp. KX64203]